MRTSTPPCLVTAAQMRAMEEFAIAGGHVTGAALMEQAGRGVVSAIWSTWPELAQGPGRAVVLCGPGNNGGDGFVIARLLADWGWEVAVYLLGDLARLPPDAAANHGRWAVMGAVHPLPMDRAPVLRGGRGVIVDALFGTGLRRGLGRDLVAGVLAPLDHADYRDWHRVAVDIPSGLCADSGRILTDAAGAGGCFAADLTVSFHAQKPGHVLGDGPDLCGQVVVCDIGLRAAEPAGAAILLGPPPASAIAKAGGHKYDHGAVLVATGGLGRSGAARLAARAALRIGAGLVTLAAPAEAMAECAAQVTAIMLRPLENGADLAEMLADHRLNALCLGPGLGLARAQALVPVALAARRPTVLDADALSAFADAPDVLFAALHPGVVLTPHDGEFARLFPDLAARLVAPAAHGPAYSRIDAARAAAARAGCVVLLKGRDTIIAAPTGACGVHAATGNRAVPWLATAGAGDVLAGMITGLMARGLPPQKAASHAAWLHVAAARAFGPGLIAEDLPEMLPPVLRGLTAP
jgi:ADP-dependent NAD(P)H-hydrate dehydratase / NAD(P)H-hydrate epimerase